MSLDPATLEANLAAALRLNFKKGKDESWTSDQAANALAKAIAENVHAYVSAAQVTGVKSDVRNPGNVLIGTGLQTGSVNLS